jgi:hypothetical protein
MRTQCFPAFGREPAALSVTDGCRGRDGDGTNMRFWPRSNWSILLTFRNLVEWQTKKRPRRRGWVQRPLVFESASGCETVVPRLYPAWTAQINFDPFSNAFVISAGASVDGTYLPPGAFPLGALRFHLKCRSRYRSTP